jgi:hypothetical protein
MKRQAPFLHYSHKWKTSPFRRFRHGLGSALGELPARIHRRVPEATQGGSGSGTFVPFFVRRDKSFSIIYFLRSQIPLQ